VYKKSYIWIFGGFMDTVSTLHLDAAGAGQEVSIILLIWRLETVKVSANPTFNSIAIATRLYK
jgi:hypothetical protein